jgi:hypothetical protein
MTTPLPELLGLVLSRLPSHADRVRTGAVCHPWRSNALVLPSHADRVRTGAMYVLADDPLPSEDDPSPRASRLPSEEADGPEGGRVR